MCKGPEAENGWFGELNVLKEDLYTYNMDSMGRRAGVVRSWVLFTMVMAPEYFDYSVGK